ncbi:MAG: hypothetical protein ACI4MY_03870 [Christensenellales bacterium]
MRKENLIEIKARQEVLKRLEYPYKQLKVATEKEVEKRKAKIEKMKQYKSLDEAHELWGFDVISDKEYEEAIEFFENSEKFINEPIIVEYALRILGSVMGGLRYEISAFEKEVEE